MEWELGSGVVVEDWFHQNWRTALWIEEILRMRNQKTLLETYRLKSFVTLAI